MTDDLLIGEILVLVGFGRNKAIEASTGTYLCFQDIDDVMLPNRINLQLDAAIKCGPKTIIGSQFSRIPKNSTIRFTNWANRLSNDKLSTQIYTSHGPTLIMPTWFMHRHVFDTVGGFESGHGVPEDLIFFYRHLTLGGKLHRVNEKLLHYTYHSNAATFSVKRETIWNLRMCHLVKNELSRPAWSLGFTIWNANRQGRKFYRMLPMELQQKVVAFCDVNPKLIGRVYAQFDQKTRKEGRQVPIVHFLDAKPPIVVCFKLDLSSGAFEKNLERLKLIEGQHYVLFS